MNKANTEETGMRAKKYWLADNPGVLTRIAKGIGVSQPFVSDVFYGRRNSKDGEVEGKLAELDAPGFKSDELIASTRPLNE